jgi:2-C-methyl-D-erythritol 2,4-cyclodiphosphate synthase/2-C-methyl-D-erythritol 4-phosphate cytidylyltransferase/2-C-methyl-D-erythritol 2,4-cyclodiphosphate synthase
VSGRFFVVGGVTIPADCGEAGHSDGDVLCHAIIDALLGAAGLGDIGEFFPAADPSYKDACSLDLLKAAWEKVRGGGWRVVNIDCVVTCEAPAILPWRDRIRESLSQALGIDKAGVFVKGKTGNGLASGAEAAAVCLLERPNG